MIQKTLRFVLIITACTSLSFGELITTFPTYELTNITSSGHVINGNGDINITPLLQGANKNYRLTCENVIGTDQRIFKLYVRLIGSIPTRSELKQSDPSIDGPWEISHDYVNLLIRDGDENSKKRTHTCLELH